MNHYGSREKRKSILKAKMFDYSTIGVTLSLTLFTQNEREDGMSPVNWRIAHKGKRKIFQIGLYYTMKEWGEFYDNNRLRHKNTKMKLNIISPMYLQKLSMNLWYLIRSALKLSPINLNKVIVKV